MNILLAFLISWGLGSTIFLPSLLARIGKWKGWYLAPFAPPFSIRGFVYFGMPASALPFAVPFMAFIPVDPQTKTEILNYIGLLGFAIGIVLAIWQPSWVKAKWLRRLENRYDSDEIRQVFIPAWRQMDRKRWGRLIETEEGLETLVQIARSSTY